MRPAQPPDLAEIVAIYNMAIPRWMATADLESVSAPCHAGPCAHGFADSELPTVAELDGVERDLSILGLRLPASDAPA